MLLSGKIITLLFAAVCITLILLCGRVIQQLLEHSIPPHIFVLIIFENNNKRTILISHK